MSSGRPTPGARRALPAFRLQPDRRNHTVICQGDRIVWDPSLTDAGIVGPMDNNYWFVEWLARVVSGKAV